MFSCNSWFSKPRIYYDFSLDLLVPCNPGTVSLIGSFWRHMLIQNVLSSLRRFFFVLSTEQKPRTYALRIKSDHHYQRELRRLRCVSQFTTALHHINGASNCVANYCFTCRVAEPSSMALSWGQDKPYIYMYHQVPLNSGRILRNIYIGLPLKVMLVDFLYFAYYMGSRVHRHLV